MKKYLVVLHTLTADGKAVDSQYSEIETDIEYKHNDIIDNYKHGFNDDLYRFVISELPYDEFMYAIYDMLWGKKVNLPPIRPSLDIENNEITFEIKNGEYYSYKIIRNEV